MNVVQMLTEQRKTYLLEILAQTGRIVAKDVSRELSLSEDTIRRDLRELASDGRLTRVHGGALPVSPSIGNLDARREFATDEKAKLAAAAYRLIKPGQVVFMDGGTTHLELVRKLVPDLKVTIITHSPSIAAALEHHLAIETILIGGRLFRHSMVAVGAETLESISRMRADICFLGVTGIHASEGLTTGDREEAAVKRALVERAAETVVLATADKLGAASAFRIVNVEKISTLIVASQGKLADAIGSADVKVIAA
jgi:DeoR/GlpR family transcriptional regulator of sugar metabolism